MIWVYRSWVMNGRYWTPMQIGTVVAPNIASATYRAGREALARHKAQSGIKHAERFRLIVHRGEHIDDPLGVEHTEQTTEG